MKLVKLRKCVCWKTIARVRVGKNLLSYFLLGMVGNKEMLYRHCFSTVL